MGVRVTGLGGRAMARRADRRAGFRWRGRAGGRALVGGWTEPAPSTRRHSFKRNLQDFHASDVCMLRVLCKSLAIRECANKKKLFLLVANMKWETRVGISMMRGWLAD